MNLVFRRKKVYARGEKSLLIVLAWARLLKAGQKMAYLMIDGRGSLRVYPVLVSCVDLVNVQCAVPR